MGYALLDPRMAEVLTWSAFLLITGILAPALALAYSEEVEQRIRRVVNGLLPATPFQNSGRYGEPAGLKDRMAHHQAPGVSIAVINDGKIEWARGFGVKEWGKPDPVTTETLLLVVHLEYLAPGFGFLSLYNIFPGFLENIAYA